MRTLATVICVCALSVAYCQTPPKAKPFTITISAKPSQIESGMQPTIVVLTKNISEPKLDCRINKYRYEVLDESGNKLPRFKKHPKPSFCVPAPCELPPGSAVSFSDYAFDRMYDLTTPGRYTIQVSLPVSDQNPKAGMIYSNKITLNVTP